MPTTSNTTKQNGSKAALLVVCVLLAMAALGIHTLLTVTHDDANNKQSANQGYSISSAALSKLGFSPASTSGVILQYHETFETSNISHLRIDEKYPCTSSVELSEWCKIPPPRVSLFRFTRSKLGTDFDPVRWRIAQLQAASGEPVLQRKILEHFPHYMDFLDGDLLFRSYHMISDHFLDPQKDMSFLSANKTEINLIGSDQVHPELPSPYFAQVVDRAPILKAGYFTFDRSGQVPVLHGTRTGERIYPRAKLLKDYKAIENSVKTPFILLSSFNENWGLFSMVFPNRTADWMPCCKPREIAETDRMLNNPLLLMMLVNQHHNYTHPKLLTLPRGLPRRVDNQNRLLWDIMRDQASKPKTSFAFIASSTWGYRPQLLECINKAFSSEKSLLEAYTFGSKLQGRMSEKSYYKKLGKARICLSIPGLGYDTFRLWESLMLGAVAVIERGVGLDKTVWKLPVLLVDDYADVTPHLLRQAYIEALYRVDQFEFERLTQKFWWSLIMEVSDSKSSSPLLKKFPPFSEDSKFTRPLEPFQCTGNLCGHGTKRTPRSYC